MAAHVGQIEFSGADHITRYDSSAWAERGFCDRCGTSLFYRYKRNDHYALWVGTFDDQSPFRLVGEIFIEDKPDGYDFAGDHPRLTGEEVIALLKES